MPIPGPYPVPTTTPPAGGGTTTPGSTPGTTPGHNMGAWLKALLDQLGGSLTPEMRAMLEARFGQAGGAYGGLGGPLTDADKTGWWGGPDDWAKIMSWMPANAAGTRTRGAHYDAEGNWVRPGAITPLTHTYGGDGAGDTAGGFDLAAYLARTKGSRGQAAVTPPPLVPASTPASGRSVYGLGSGSVAGSTRGAAAAGASAVGTTAPASTPTSWLTSWFGR